MPIATGFLYMLGFIASSTGASLLFKLAADQQVRRAMIGYFVLGNLAGVFAPVFLTLALRGTHANYVYAICYGVSFCALQIVSFLFFRQALSPYQWAGIACVAAGVLLLQVRAL